MLRPGSLRFALIFLLLSVSFLRAEDRLLLRISTENSRDHLQTKTLMKFREFVGSKLGAALEVELYYDGRLYRDRSVLSALQSGKLEMAVPGIWNLEPWEPNFGLFLLPFMYGRTGEETHLLADGSVGAGITKRIEDRYNVVALGKWLDLGHAHLFTIKKALTSYDDLENLRIRSPGGRANELRLRALGAAAASVPWTDLAEKITAGSLDGILTTYETVASGKLWSYGVKTAFEDNQYFPMYVPLLSRTFWNRLKEEQKTMLREGWTKLAETEREEAVLAQKEAKNLFLRMGGKVTVPKPNESAEARERILRLQNDFIAGLDMDTALVDRALKQLTGGR